MLAFSKPSSVTPQQQCTNSACWITSAATLKSWRGGALITPEQLTAKLGEPWLLQFETDVGLPREMYLDFATAADLHFLS